MNSYFDKLVDVAKTVSTLAIESKTLVADYEKTIHDLTVRIQQLEGEKGLLQERIDQAIEKISSQDNRIYELESKLDTLEEEKQDFTKVSHVVAIEKENAKLRKEVMEMSSKLRAVANERLLQHQVMLNQQKQTPTTQPQEEELESESDETFEVFEKRFNRKSYFVSNDRNMYIYAKLENGEIGDKLGHCVKEGQKLVPYFE